MFFDFFKTKKTAITITKQEKKNLDYLPKVNTVPRMI